MFFGARELKLEFGKEHGEVQLIELMNGKSLLIVDGYPFYKKQAAKGELVKLVDGKELFILNGFTYYRRWAVGHGLNSRWSCTNSSKCRAYIHLDCEMNVIYTSKHEHLHPTRPLHRNSEVNIFMTTRGKERLIYHDYTYYKQSRTKCGFRWGCTKNRWHKCKAYLHLADDMTIVRSNMQHTHSPFSTPLRKRQRKVELDE